MNNIIEMISELEHQKKFLYNEIEQDLDIEDARFVDIFPNPFMYDIQFHDGDWIEDWVEIDNGFMYFVNCIRNNEKYYYLDTDSFDNSFEKLVGNNYTYFKNEDKWLVLNNDKQINR